MTVTLNPEHEAILERAVRAGRFASHQDAFNAAVHSLEYETTLPNEAQEHCNVIQSRSLFELMQESPLFGSDIEFERDRSPLRDSGF